MGERKNHEDQHFKGYTTGGTRKGLAEENTKNRTNRGHIERC
jgi:hypothetical protein